MCVVSMVMDQGLTVPRDWWKLQPQVPNFPPTVYPNLEFFNELLEKAKKYDELTKQPDCENDEKRKALKKIADELGIEIKFV